MLRFTPFWKLTRWGFLFPSMFGPALKINPGTDEHHNRTKFLIVPLVGEFTWWLTTNFDGPEHVYARSHGAWEGYIDPDCAICHEIVTEFDAP